MKVEFLYGTAVITLPADVKKHISRASQNDLRVLVACAGVRHIGGRSYCVACILARGGDNQNNGLRRAARRVGGADGGARGSKRACAVSNDRRRD